MITCRYNSQERVRASVNEDPKTFSAGRSQYFHTYTLQKSTQNGNFIVASQRIKLNKSPSQRKHYRCRNYGNSLGTNRNLNIFPAGDNRSCCSAASSSSLVFVSSPASCSPGTVNDVYVSDSLCSAHRELYCDYGRESGSCQTTQ